MIDMEKGQTLSSVPKEFVIKESFEAAQKEFKSEFGIKKIRLEGYDKRLRQVLISYPVDQTPDHLVSRISVEFRLVQFSHDGTVSSVTVFKP